MHYIQKTNIISLPSISEFWLIVCCEIITRGEKKGIKFKIIIIQEETILTSFFYLYIF